MLWCKLHTGIHRNPKIRKAGPRARDLYILLLCLNGEHEFNGVIPADYADPDCLALDLGETRETACNALETARNAGLFHVDEAGNLVLTGYSDAWRPKLDKSTERVRAHRERKLASQRDDSHVTGETQVKPFHETAGNGGTGVTPSEESRGEKRREEKKESVAAPLLVAGALEVAEYLLAAIRSHKPDAKGEPKAWARDIDLAIRVDGRTVDSLKRAVDQAHRSADPFWRSNLLSGKALRKQCDRLLIKAAQPPLGTRASPTGAKTYSPAEMAEMARAEFEFERGGSR
jgi:hypothetical protein